jgi:hypothetical protein
MTVDADGFRSDALGNMTAHLAGPLAAGVRQSIIPLDGGGAAVIAEATRHPLLLVVLTVDLGGDDDRTIDVTVAGGAAVRLRFAPYTERGATLAVPVAGAGPPIAVHVAPHADVEVRLVDGVLARLLYAHAAEKGRLRRVAREIAAGRRLASARGDALDRLGVELRVPRFRANLSWSESEEEIVATPGDEGDASYRHRLALYRPQVRPTRVELDAALPGLMAGVGYTGDLAIAESDTELAIAIRVVSPPDDARRVAHLAYLRRQFLLPVDAGELPANRLVSIAERTRARELLARLKATTIWPAGAHVAPSIATAIERAARCTAALGAPGAIEVTQAQRDDGGSRYELGVGVDVRAFDSSVAQALADALRAGTFAGNPDPETLLLLSKMTPEDAEHDGVARWLFRGCGLRTAQFIGGGTVFLSHLPIHGATLDVTETPAGLELSAVLRGEGAVTTIDANLASTLSTAVDDPSPWSLSPLSAIADATPPPAPAVTLFTAAHLTTPTTAVATGRVLAALATAPTELLAVLRGNGSISAGMLAGNAAGATALQSVVERLRAAGAVSILPLVSGGSVFLVVGMTDLPGNATVFNRRRAHFRWLTAPLEADRRIGTLDQRQGVRNRYLFAGGASASQVAAIIAVTPTRPEPRHLHRRIEPYTVTVDRADQDQPLLSFAQYEYLMNLLDRWCPLGVTVDTSRLRAQAVDIDGDGAADLMSLRLQRTFRPFRGRRALGARS